jgi:hypothetical protein
MKGEQMKKPKYIEAMVTEGGNGYGVGDHEINFDGDSLRSSIHAAIEKESKRAKEANAKVTREQLVDVVMKAVYDNLDCFDCQAGEHECGGAPVEPVSNPESITRQMRNTFLNAELVAIIRLDDLEKLIATAENHDDCAIDVPDVPPLSSFADEVEELIAR